MDLKRKLDYILKDERKREYTQNNSYKIMEFYKTLRLFCQENLKFK